MARPAYSRNLIYLPSIEGPTALGGPPEGYLWVVRTLMCTVGNYFGFAAGGLGLFEEGPWSWLALSPQSRYVGISHTTFTWEGRYVVPGGYDLYGNTTPGDTMDFKIDGYELSVSGAYD